MTNRAPSFQLYARDYLSDVRYRQASWAARGLLMELFCVIWLEGSLPNDTGRLARICGMSKAKFERLWEEISTFFTAQGDVLIQKRLHAQLETTRAFRERQAMNGAKGGRPRRINEGENPSLSSGEPKEKPDQTPASASSSASSPSEHESEERGRVLDGEQQEGTTSPARPPSESTSTATATTIHDSLAVAHRYIAIYNEAHEKRADPTSGIKALIRNALKADPPLSPDDIYAVALMSSLDDFYADLSASMPLRVSERKDHPHDLLGNISSAVKYPKRFKELVKKLGMSAYFNERTAKR